LDGFYSDRNDKFTLGEKERFYFLSVQANRTYQYTICRYKEVRYNQKEVDADTWSQIDLMLRNSIELYSTLVHPSNKKYIYVDLIIKLMILRGYVNTQARKYITAEKIFRQTKKVLKFVQSDYSPQINFDLRIGVPVVPFDILKQKYLLYKAIHLVYLGRKEQAVEKLLKSLNTGTIFDAKVRKECLYQVS